MRCLVLPFVLVVFAAARAPRARADGLNYLAGPVLGISWGKRGTTPLVGVEGGIGAGPERLNIGVEHRGHEVFGYVELDPWYFIGASLGIGAGSESGPTGLVGLWEGVPYKYPNCDGGAAATISIGYRYTGVHELYVAPKWGVETDPVCLH